jgi:5-methyltetrahydropteroyltriglutamate--homocysteine methyltransferase
LARPDAPDAPPTNNDTSVSETDLLRNQVLDVVASQLDAGLALISDGDRPTDGMTGWVLDRLAGFELRPAEATPVAARREPWDFPEFFARAYSARDVQTLLPVCTGAVAWAGSDLVARDIANLVDAAPGTDAADLFLAAPGPGSITRACANLHYEDVEDYEKAVAHALAPAYAAVVDAGLTLQVGVEWAGSRRRLARDLELLDEALRNVPGDGVRLAVSYGNVEGPHHDDPALGDILDLLLRAKPCGLCVVGANGRHEADAEIWDEVSLPDDKVLVQGVIDSTTNIVEHPATVSDRLVRLARTVGAESIIAGVDGAFAPAPGLQREFRVTADVMWAKLAALARGAELAGEELSRGTRVATRTGVSG